MQGTSVGGNSYRTAVTTRHLRMAPPRGKSAAPTQGDSVAQFPTGGVLLAG